MEREQDWFVEQVIREEEAVAECKACLGWRVYLSNGAAQGHSMGAGTVLRAYHQQYRVERDFQRLKGRPLGISPMYLHRDGHRKGLIRLLTLGLRVLTVLEYVVRRALAAQGKSLYGLYEGNPKRGTRSPTAERLLRAFKGLPLSIVCWGEEWHVHVSALSTLQRQILSLLGFSEDIYRMIATQSDHPP